MAFVMCPNCGTSVDETALRCPACHADLAATMRMPRQVGTWCKGCGALVPDGLDACPACGLPVDSARTGPSVTSAQHDADGSASAEEATLVAAQQALPRIESALPIDPAEVRGDEDSDALPHAQQVLVLVVAAAAVLAVVVAIITHPWDPDAYSTRATTAADTSKVGFPGEVEKLTSQDRTVPDADEPAAPADDTPAADTPLHELWVRLGTFREELAANELLVRQAAEGELEYEDGVEGADEAGKTATAISNAISDVQEVASGMGAADTDEADRLSTLGNWLRNWSDTIVYAWELSAEVDYAEAPWVCDPLDEVAGTDGRNSYQRLFDESYKRWEPATH